jgi:hypothetical protein
MTKPVYGPADTPRRVRLNVSHPDIHQGGPTQPRGAGMTMPQQTHRSTAAPVDTLMDSADVQRLVTRELEQWQNDLQPFYNKANESWAKWVLEPVDPKTNPFRSRVQSAYPMYAIEQIMPRLVGQNPSMNYQPLDTDRDSLIASLLGKVVSAQMKRMGFEYVIRDFVKQALVTGYSVGKVYWVRQSQRRVQTTVEQHPFVEGEPDLGAYNVEVPQHVDEVTINEPRFEVVNVLDFAWPLYAKSLNDAKAVWQRRWLTIEELEEKAAQGVYQNIEQIAPSDANRWTQAYDPQFAAQGLVGTPPMTQTGDTNDADALIEVWERWADDRLTVIANRRVCIRDCPNPFDHKRKPFIDFTPMPRPFQLQGMSIIDTINDINESLSTLMRQISDAITLIVNPVYKSTGGVDWGNFVMQPGAHLDLDDTEDVQPLIQPNVDLAAALQWRQAYQQDMQRYSGVFDIEGGFSLGGTHTATGVSTVIQQATMRLTEIINVLSYRSMRPFGYMMERLNAQYLDAAVLVDFSNDPEAQQAWQSYVTDVEPQNVFGWVRRRLGQDQTSSTIPESGLVAIHPEMVRAQGRLEPIPQVGQDKQTSDTQKRSDASQLAQALAPIMANPQNPIDMSVLTSYIAQQYDAPESVQKALVKTPQPQQIAQMTAAQGGPPSASGPSGDNLSTGGVTGTPGAAGGVGTNGLGSK